MVGKESLRTHEVLNFSFEKLMMVDCGGNSGKGVNFKAGVITEWKDIPVELLMQILSLVDDQTVMIASEVCRGWREAICFGLTRLSLSWYIFFFFFTFPPNSLLRLFCLEAVKIEKAGFNFYFANTYKICCAFIFWFQNDLYIVNDKKMFSLFGLQMFEHMK